jgi:adenosylcobinamide kinase / adenosylcobinamide-phosphate guanylyltransferase
MKHLILGGVKSGKSRYAEEAAKALSDKVAVIVTAEPLDDEMKARIARHVADRPAHWITKEAYVDLAGALDQLNDDSNIDVVIIDCLTLWITNLLVKPEVAEELERHICRFEEALGRFTKPVLLVSNETNLGIMPMDKLSRRFCDETGRLHQRLALVCDRVDLLVAGLPVSVKSP